MDTQPGESFQEIAQASLPLQDQLQPGPSGLNPPLGSFSLMDMVLDSPSSQEVQWNSSIENQLANTLDINWAQNRSCLSFWRPSCFWKQKLIIVEIVLFVARRLLLITNVRTKRLEEFYVTLNFSWEAKIGTDAPNVFILEWPPLQ